MNVSELGLVTPAGKVVWGKYSCLFYGKVFIITIIISVEFNLLSSGSVLRFCSLFEARIYFLGSRSFV